MAPFSSVLIQHYDHSQWPFAFSYDNWECPRVELGVGLNILEIQF